MSGDASKATTSHGESACGLSEKRDRMSWWRRNVLAQFAPTSMYTLRGPRLRGGFGRVSTVSVVSAIMNAHCARAQRLSPPRSPTTAATGEAPAGQRTPHRFLFWKEPSETHGPSTHMLRHSHRMATQHDTSCWSKKKGALPAREHDRSWDAAGRCCGATTWPPARAGEPHQTPPLAALGRDAAARFLMVARP